ncbi:MAG TPA: Gfo/Idh/MocA family oxidoreductase [Marmoricola sp.]|nr:Gfo/Idh/MocA family oxidoreductase [Marmoricola sp.]
MGDRSVLLVGLGTIARTHVDVLSALDGFALVGGVDPRPALADVAPVFGDLDAAFDAGLRPDLVVVATPTPTHVAIVADLLERCDATVLSEKPLSTTRSEVAELERLAGRDRVATGVRVAHHFAFSPEVEWARGTVERNPGWGRPSSILSVFNDRYAGLPPTQRASYVSSWVDSGPNQLSIVAAFAREWTVVSHDDRGDRAVTTLDHEGGRTLLSSNWLAADTSKQTTIRFDDVGVEIRMDHTSMTGLLLVDGEIVEHAGYTESAGRKEAHYLGLYRALRDDPDDVRLSVELARTIAATLESGAGVAPSALQWSSVTDDP